MSYLPLSCLSEDSLSKADFYPVKSGMQREMTHDISSFQKCTDGKVVAGTCFSRDKQIHTGYQTDMWCNGFQIFFTAAQVLLILTNI